MRCYMCDGRGMRYDGFQNLYRTCEKCGGSGIAEPLTNEEYIHSLKGEELAEFLVEHAEELTAPDGDYHKHVERFVVGWLKEKRDDNQGT